ncbi:MAG: segregation/condensation protein A [Clostridia bacterium]|nr:segregation/condensation protein A [Clostridia bacterium]
MEPISYKLEVFEGPLDLLLHLISKHKIDIMDIPIALILEQYLAYLEQLRELDMDITADFMVMASELMLIKSRMLLPKNEEEEEEDPRARLAAMLLEYQKYKRLCAAMEEKVKLGMARYTKTPDPIVLPKTYEGRHEINVLAGAYATVLERTQSRLPPSPRNIARILDAAPSPLPSRTVDILRRLVRDKKVSFLSLFTPNASRAEIVSVFLTMLELSRNRRLLIQGEAAEDMTLTYQQQKKEVNA